MSQPCAPTGCCTCCEYDHYSGPPFQATLGLKVDVTPDLLASLVPSDEGQTLLSKALSRLLTPSTPRNVVHLWRVEKSKG